VTSAGASGDVEVRAVALVMTGDEELAEAREEGEPMPGSNTWPPCVWPESCNAVFGWRLAWTKTSGSWQRTMARS